MIQENPHERSATVEDTIFRFSTADNRSAFPGLNHYHDIWEIYRLTEGYCHYFIDNKTYRLETGDLVVIPPGVIHNVIYGPAKHSRMLINCSTACIPAVCETSLRQTVLFSPDPKCARQIEDIYAKLYWEAQESSAESSAMSVALCWQLLILLCRQGGAPRVTASSPFVEDALEYIHQNVASHLSLTDTARHCAVSPEHLSRVFRKETGFGFNEYINIYRLKRAEAMLKNGNPNSVTQVAHACGFADSNYFSKAYRKMYGVAPSKVKNE